MRKPMVGERGVGSMTRPAFLLVRGELGIMSGHRGDGIANQTGSRGSTMRHAASLIGLTVLASMFLARPAHAEIVTWEFTGTVDSVHDDDNLLGGAVTVGSPLRGSFSIDMTTPDTDPRPTRGFFVDAVDAMTGTLGTSDFTGPVKNPKLPASDLITITNDFRDADGLFAQVETSLLDVPTRFQLSISFHPSAFPDDSLPASPPPLEMRLAPGFFRFVYEALGPGFNIAGRTDSISAVPACTVVSTFPPNGKTLPRIRRNLIRVTLDAASDVPVGPGDIEIVEMLEGGGFGPDLSESFTVEDSDGVITIQDTGATLENKTWYRVRSTGLNACLDLDLCLLVLMGDVNGDRFVNWGGDMIRIYAAIPTLSVETDDEVRRDITGDGLINFADMGAQNYFVPAMWPPIPSGHTCP